MASLKKLKEALLPFYTEQELEKSTQYYIDTQCQNVAPSREDEPNRTHAFATKQSLVPFFINKGFDKNIADKFYMILADSGMGKTTFMINLYLNYAKKMSGTPYQVRIFPLGNPEILEEVDKIAPEQRKNTIVLLDAFDEDNEAIKDYKARLRTIIDKVSDFKEVIITCRTQFFPTEEEEPKETGVVAIQDRNKEYIFRKLYISPFDVHDIEKYLNKKYNFFQGKKKKRAMMIVNQSPNLMVRPMLLSYIDDLLQSNEAYLFSYQIYAQLIAKWIEREVQRSVKNKDEYREELYKFSRAVAIDIFKKRNERSGFFIHANEVKPLAEKYEIHLSDLELKSRSLLNRNAKSQFKFSHKSILEYFVAEEAFQNAEFAKNIDFKEVELTGQFYDEMFHSLVKKLGGLYKLEKTDDSQMLANIKPYEMKKVKYVSLESISKDALSALRGFRNLQRLQIANIQLSGEKLRNFLFENTLDLKEKYLLDIQVFSHLDNITYIDLTNNQLVDTKDFVMMQQLESLNLSANKITDITQINQLPKLASLNLSTNRLSRIDAITGVSQLQSLDLSYNQITDIKPLQALKNLTFLDLSYNPIKDITHLQALKHLTLLNLTGVQGLTAESIDILKAFLPACEIRYQTELTQDA